MPTSTISGVDLVNLGPLTTTWSAPTSCASPPLSVQLAYATNYKDGVAMWWDNCDVRTDIYDECMPSAPPANREWASRQAELNPQRLDFQLYHSPGIACPADWFTAGLAIKEGPSSYIVNGSFADPTFTRTFPTRTTTMSQITPGFRPSNEIFLSAMEVSETAVICCPSGFTARWAGGACFSTVSNEAYTATTGCQLQFASRIETVLLETYTFYGRPITGLMAYTTATTMSFKTTIETIKPADSTQYIGLVATPAVTLVHKQSDVGEIPLTGKTSPTSTSGAVSSSKMSLRRLVKGLALAWGLVAVIETVAESLS